jgi:hypothetical protein
MTQNAISQGLEFMQSLPPQEMLVNGIQVGNLETVKLAITKGADINLKENLPLCQAIDAVIIIDLPGEDNLLKTLAEQYGLPAPTRNTYLEIINWLLQNGAKTTTSSDFEYHNIPLLLAVDCRDTEIIKLLLDFGADPNSHDQYGKTALHILAAPADFIPASPYKNGPEIAELLISKGAKMTSNEFIGAPLEVARESLKKIEAPGSEFRLEKYYNELVNSLESLIEIYSKF